MRTTAGAVALLVATAAVPGCAGREDGYCDALQQAQVQLSDMVSSGRPGALVTGLPLLHDLARKAPDDLGDEWQTLLNAVEGLRQALSAADLGVDDVTGGRIPARVRGEPRRTLRAAADRLGSTEVTAAADGIETQARDVCKVNLGV